MENVDLKVAVMIYFFHQSCGNVLPPQKHVVKFSTIYRSRRFRIEFGIPNEIIRKQLGNLDFCHFLGRKKLGKLDLIIFNGGKRCGNLDFVIFDGEKFGK